MDTTEALKRLLVAILSACWSASTASAPSYARGDTASRAAHLPAHRPLRRRAIPAAGCGGPCLCHWLVAVSAIALVSYRKARRRRGSRDHRDRRPATYVCLRATAGVGRLAIAAPWVSPSPSCWLRTPPERMSRALSERRSSLSSWPAITAIVMPPLPDQRSPGGVRPLPISVLVVPIVCSVRGFVAVRWKGERAGLFWAAASGALVSKHGDHGIDGAAIARRWPGTAARARRRRRCSHPRSRVCASRFSSRSRAVCCCRPWPSRSALPWSWVLLTTLLLVQ